MVDEMAKATLAGVYPWLRFEPHTRKQWIEWNGFDLEVIDEQAAKVYLDDESDFFDKFDELERFAEIAEKRPDGKQFILEETRNDFMFGADICESPIEQVMLASLMWHSYEYNLWLPEVWDSDMPFSKPVSDVVIAPQHKIDKYRVDFGIFINGDEEIKIVVECDGHIFHEKTKEQASRDKRRDRELQIAGWKVLRFTGSEIRRDNKGCADQVANLAVNELLAQLERRGLFPRSENP